MLVWKLLHCSCPITAGLQKKRPIRNPAGNIYLWESCDVKLRQALLPSQAPLARAGRWGRSCTFLFVLNFRFSHSLIGSMRWFLFFPFERHIWTFCQVFICSYCIPICEEPPRVHKRKGMYSPLLPSVCTWHIQDSAACHRIHLHRGCFVEAPTQKTRIVRSAVTGPGNPTRTTTATFRYSASLQAIIMHRPVGVTRYEEARRLWRRLSRGQQTRDVPQSGCCT